VTVKVITVAHRKGGVGKTTTVIHLATGLADLGLPTIAMDLDPQGNLGQFLGLGAAPDMYDLLMSRHPGRLLSSALMRVENYPKLAVIRGDDETKAAERALGAPEASRTLSVALQGIITAIKHQSNGTQVFVFLDTPPGLGSLQLAALTVSQYLIIPVNPSYASETGLPKIGEEIQALREKRGRGARLIGILPTRYKRRALEHQEVLGGLRETFGDLLYPPVRDTVRLEETLARGVPVWNYDPTGIGAQDYARVLVRLVRDLGIRVNGNGKNRRGG